MASPNRFRRAWFAFKTRIVVTLDLFLGWPPAAQISIIAILTAALIGAWGIAWSIALGTSTTEGVWQALTHFMDGGTMASDHGRVMKILGTGVTWTGVLLLAFLTGAFASKLGERIGDLRSGRSPIIDAHHILILGFDSKVPLIVRELARSHQKLSVVILAQEDKSRLDAVFRFIRRLPDSRIRITTRTGDPRVEMALLRVCADHARTILVIAPAKLDDEHALRWSVSALLAIRRAVGTQFKGRIVVESRRANHGALLALTGEPGVAGSFGVPIEVFASDDIVARVLAQSIRQNGIYFALRELLSFRGDELHLEPVPDSLLGKTFDEAHMLVENGILVGFIRPGERHWMSPCFGDPRVLTRKDSLILLEPDRAAFRVARPIHHKGDGVDRGKPNGIGACAHEATRTDPQTILILGSNRTLPRLICELDRLLAKGSRLEIVSPPLSSREETAVEQSAAECKSVTVGRTERDFSHLTILDDERLYAADGVVILGCEDEEDPDGDASALSLLLQLRHRTKGGGHKVKRLVTEVRDPAAAQQIAGRAHDFLVSNDVVAMVLAQAALEPRLTGAIRELLDPTGVEVYLVPRAKYVGEGRVTFGEVMAEARRRGDVAIGFFPIARAWSAECPRTEIELGHLEVDEMNPVCLNPPRSTEVPDGPEAAIVVLADPTAEASLEHTRPREAISQEA